MKIVRKFTTAALTTVAALGLVAVTANSASAAGAQRSCPEVHASGTQTRHGLAIETYIDVSVSGKPGHYEADFYGAPTDFHNKTNKTIRRGGVEGLQFHSSRANVTQRGKFKITIKPNSNYNAYQGGGFLFDKLSIHAGERVRAVLVTNDGLYTSPWIVAPTAAAGNCG